MKSRRPTDGRSGPGTTFDLSKRLSALSPSLRGMHDGMRDRRPAALGADPKLDRAAPKAFSRTGS